MWVGTSPSYSSICHLEHIQQGWPQSGERRRVGPWDGFVNSAHLLPAPWPVCLQGSKWEQSLPWKVSSSGCDSFGPARSPCPQPAALLPIPIHAPEPPQRFLPCKITGCLEFMTLTDSTHPLEGMLCSFIINAISRY